MTTEPNAQPTAQSAWAQALKGKTGASPVAAHSKKMFLILSGSFFLCFCFLYMIYNVRHSQTAAQAGANVQAIPAGTQMQAPMQTPMQAQPGAAFTGNQFGAPRIDAGAPATVSSASSMAVDQPMAMAPAQAPTGMPAYGQPSPYGAVPAAAYPTSASYPPAAAYTPSSYAGPHMAYAQHQRSDLVISAPRQFRHSIPTLGAGGQPEPLNQRHRTYVAR
jgi:hypothetical protein